MIFTYRYGMFYSEQTVGEGGSDKVANYTEEQWNAKKEELMEKCFDCFAEHGLHGTGIRVLANECGFYHTKLYTYFKDLDDLIIQSTEYCMRWKRILWRKLR